MADSNCTIGELKKLTSTEISERMAGCLAEGNSEAMQALVEYVRTVNNGNVDYDMVEIILRGDYIDAAREYLDHPIIQQWCDENKAYVVHNCPKLFDQWAYFYPEIVECVGIFLETLPEDERCSVLKGDFVSEQNLFSRKKFFYDALKNDSTCWSCLSPVWLDKPNSPIRQAAASLGWSPTMLASMRHNFLYGQLEADWSEVLTYPYSLFLLARKVEQDIAPHKAMVFTANLVDFTDASNAHAKAWDVELACAIVEQTGLQGIEIKRYESTLAKDDIAYLKNLVAAHASIGCLDMLLSSLCHDTILQDGNYRLGVSTLALPDSYDSLEGEGESHGPK